MAKITGILKSAKKIMRQDTSTGNYELRVLQLGRKPFCIIFNDKEKESRLVHPVKSPTWQT